MPNDTRWTSDHREYVGGLWAEAAATTMTKLWKLGLKPHHRVLDVGCGSLRIGRFLLLYLKPAHYVGVEPVVWPLQTALKEEPGVGELAAMRGARFFSSLEDVWANPDIPCLDFVLAHGIFPHASLEECRKILVHSKELLKPEGTFVASFKPGDEDQNPEPWTYPQGRTHSSRNLRGYAMGLWKKVWIDQEGHSRKGHVWLIAQ